MSKASFPVKDLSRRKLSTFLIIFGLTICVSSTVFLILLGDSLGLKIEAVTEDQMVGFSYIFSRFIIFVSILNLLVGAIVVFFLFSLAMSERAKDIGVMKAFGCLTSSVFSIFATELSIMIFSGCIVGTVCGLVAHLVISSIIGLPFVGNINWGLVILVFLGFLSLAHLFGARPIARTIQMKPADALSTSYLYSTTTEFSGKRLSRLGLTLRVAIRNLMRRALPTRNILLCLIIIFTLVTVAVAGGLVASETTASYLERAMGKDIVLIAHKNLTKQYANLLLQFQEANPIESIDYLAPQHALPESLITRLTNISSVVKSEKRLLFETTAYEGYGIIFDPYDSTKYYFVGEGRFGKTCVMGIKPADVVANWFIEGKSLTDSTSEYALIGHTLADSMFTFPHNQTIALCETYYKIAGICIDPFNNGNITYLSFNSLPSELKDFGYNLLFLKINPVSRSQALTELAHFLSGTSFEFLELNIILNENLVFLQNIWSLTMLLPLSSLVAAIFCLFTYLMVSITLQQREFGIMRAVGAKLNVVAKIVVTQVLIVLSASASIGTLIGFLLIYLFLIPEPTISVTAASYFASALILTIIFLTLFSLYSTFKIIKKSIPEKLHPL